MKLSCSVFYIITLFALFHDTVCQSEDYTVCGKRQKDEVETAFIFKDSQIRNPPGSWPWVVSIGEKDSVHIWTHRCGGSLITPVFVLTNAHCGLGMDRLIKKGDIFIRAGDDDLQDDKDDEGVEEVQVVDYKVHPNYNRPVHYSDIAVLRLARPVSLSAVIRTVCLPAEAISRQEDDRLPLTVTGWGSDKEDQSGKSLFDTFVQVYSEAHCNRTHNGERKSQKTVPSGFSSDLLCGGDPSGSEGVCQGDSGSPAVLFKDVPNSYVLKAIVTGGLSCGTRTHPNIYVRISDSTILTWIYQQINKTLTLNPTAIAIAQTDKNCSPDEECEKKAGCPYVQEKYRELQGLNKEHERRRDIVQELKAVICNKKEKAFCCPKKEWSQWNRWGICSKPCGGGTRRRTRTCPGGAPDKNLSIRISGVGCSGGSRESFQTSSCNTGRCPVGGGGLSSECVTVGGSDRGATCVFPFKFKGKSYSGCTLEGADDGKPWCSTLVDAQGAHVGGQGKWGHCGQGCIQDVEQTGPLRASTILIHSLGAAAEIYGGLLGYFDRTDQTVYGRPVYSQKGGTALVYYLRDAWVVGSSPKIAFYVTSQDREPPPMGWFTGDGNGNWVVDNTLTLTTTPPDPSSTCTTIQVAATGPAGVFHSDLMGLYYWEGEWLNGHKVFRGGRGNFYLRIVTGITVWSIGIGKDIDINFEANLRIISGRGTTCPCQGEAGPSSKDGVAWWRWYDGNGFLVDGSIQVTCV